MHVFHPFAERVRFGLRAAVSEFRVRDDWSRISRSSIEQIAFALEQPVRAAVPGRSESEEDKAV